MGLGIIHGTGAGGGSNSYKTQILSQTEYDALAVDNRDTFYHISADGYKIDASYCGKNISDACTKLLLKFDGNLLDSSVAPKIATGYNGITTPNNTCLFERSKSQYITIPHSADFEFGAGEFTIDTWIYLNTINIQQFIACEHMYTQLGSYYLTVEPDNTVRSVLYYTTSNSVLIKTTAKLQLKTWHHVALVRSGNTIMLFIDGILSASAAYTYSLVNPNTVFTIGRQTNETLYLDGMLDNFRIAKGLARWTANFTLPIR